MSPDGMTTLKAAFPLFSFPESQSMNVLISSANTLPSVPSGPAYIAGTVPEAGHSRGL